jgi:hypothetical protein
VTRTRWIALILLMAVIGGGVALQRHRLDRVAKQRAQLTVQAPSPSTRAATSSPVPTPRTPTREGIAADSERSAHDWSQLAERAIEAKNSRALGADAAKLLQMQPVQAWKALTERAHDGDQGAAKAALLLASECNTAGLLASASAPTHASYVDRLVDGMPQDWGRFVRAIDNAAEQRQHDRVTDCEGVGGTMDFAMMVIDRFLDADDPQIQLDATLDNPDDAEAIGDLRHLADELHDTRSRRALGERLMRSRDPAEYAEGRIILAELARAGDNEAIVFLASELANPLRQRPDQPPETDDWIGIAAGLGEWSLLNTQIGNLLASNHPVDAFSWALYRLQLAQAACFEVGRPAIFYVAVSAKDVFKQQAGLSADQMALARDGLVAINLLWRAQADAWLGCEG